MTPANCRSTQLERWLLSGTLACIYAVYVCSSFALVSTNDGAHFATARALVERGTFAIDDGVAFALNDVASHDGVAYSNKPPGSAIIAVPLLAASKALAPVLEMAPDPRDEHWLLVLAQVARESGQDISREDLVRMYRETYQAQCFAALVAALAGVLALWMVYRTSRHLGAPVWAALFTVIALGLGSLLWRYSSAFFAHSISAALLMLQIEWLVSGRARSSAGNGLVWGVLLGTGVAVEYQAAFSVPFLLIGWLTAGSGWGRVSREDGRRLALVFSGAAVPVLGLVIYHIACFGGPMRTPVAASDHFGYWGTLGSILSGDPVIAARHLIFGRGDPVYGMLTVSPLLLPACLGWLCWPARLRTLRALLLGIVALHCTLVFYLVSPEGGDTVDHRYLVRILPVLMLPLPLLLERVRSALWRERLLRWPLLLVAGALVAWPFCTGIYRGLQSVAFFMKHMIRLPEPPHLEMGVGIVVQAAFPTAIDWRFALASTLVYLTTATLAWRWLGEGVQARNTA